MSHEEFTRLVAATQRSGEPFRDLDGESRAMLYTVAAATGFRASELASVTPQSFDLDGSPATLTVRAGYSKHRKQNVQPITPALVPHLRVFLAGKEADAKIWPGTWTERAARMLKKDLAAAGSPYADDDGRVFDFHALRGRFITSLGRAGVPLVTAQKLARHSDPKLTANVYTHLAMIDLAGAVENLRISLAAPLALNGCTRLHSPASSRQQNRVKTA